MSNGRFYATSKKETHPLQLAAHPCVPALWRITGSGSPRVQKISEARRGNERNQCRKDVRVQSGDPTPIRGMKVRRPLQGSRPKPAFFFAVRLCLFYLKRASKERKRFCQIRPHFILHCFLGCTALVVHRMLCSERS